MTKKEEPRKYAESREEIINEFDWYEDLVLKWNIDSSGDIVLTENDD